MTVSPLYIKNIISGSDIIFRGMDDPEKIKSISQPTRVWVEEATEISPEDFNQLDLRLRGKNKDLQISLSFNPVSDQHFLITDFWNK
jgi:phage terminase large subunit